MWAAQTGKSTRTPFAAVKTTGLLGRASPLAERKDGQINQSRPQDKDQAVAGPGRPAGLVETDLARSGAQPAHLAAVDKPGGQSSCLEEPRPPQPHVNPAGRLNHNNYLS